MYERNDNSVEEKYVQLKEKVLLLEKKKEAISQKLFKSIYVFASFDLVNSTKMKYREANWLRVINELIDRSGSEWFGLKFWKYNGDELLYYAEITGINQLARILHQIYQKSNNLQEKLLKELSSDESLGFARDLVGIKTAVWMAYVSDEKDAINAKLNIDYMDFAGINIDEGFRMSKCAIQNKIIVDPKIAMLISLVADELYTEKISRLDPNTQYERNDDALKNVDEVFTKFWLNIVRSTDQNVVKPTNELFEREKDLFKIVANNFRIVGYEKCKGVWDDRPYPIIWYSDNWDKSIESVKYDEVYNGVAVSKTLINTYYHDYEHSYLDTLKILKKIYDNVSVYSYVIRKILLECGFRLYAKDGMDKQYYALTYLYYTIVCINKSTGGVLAFLRSPQRGHLPGVWDFEQQKNAHTLDSEFTITQIEDRFKKNYGISIKVVDDKNRNSVVPMGIHPIYRRGKIHTGILCFAYIDENAGSEEQIIKQIKSNLPQVKSNYDYPLYSDARFIHKDDLKLGQGKNALAVEINEEVITEMTYEEMLSDSNTWNNHCKNTETISMQCTHNFVITIEEAIDYGRKECSESTK